jgi:SPP1 gp7 family putative phage head morphogenesis protein
MRYTFADLVAAAQAIDKVERMKAELAEFAAQHLQGDDGVLEFLEISSGDAFDVPPTEALGYFRSKGLRPTFSYADMIGRANDQAFTVAKMLDVDLLAQVRDSLDSALANGTTFGQWRRELEPVLRAAGWWGKGPMPDPITGQVVDAQLGSAWRLETIFRTNLQTAYAAGQWREIQAQADLAPFLMYDAVDDFRTREQHRAWDSKVLPVTSPWWRTHYPPNGWNCRCGVIQLDAEQVAAMGITPLADPPEDGAYTWTNPRTGERVRVPNGLDPGFDRNPGDMAIDNLRELLREKVAVLPPDMRAAVAPVLRREFDTSTEAGRWHAASFNAAPDWLREKVLDQQAVRVEFQARTAHAQLGAKIDMDGKKVDTANGQSVWRHEFGHILDARLATAALYRSVQADFVAAQRDDADDLVKAAAAGRPSKATTARRATLDEAYRSVGERVAITTPEARTELLRELAQAADLDFGQFVQLVQQSTLILDEGAGGITSVGNAVRVARMIEAVRLRDVEAFLRFASFKDLVEDNAARRQYDTAIIQQHGRSWRKDGSLSSLSDLAGSATRNKVASYNRGFPGHSDSYYKGAPFYPTTESFANLSALAGAANPYWWELARRFTPRMADLFRKIIEGDA